MFDKLRDSAVASLQKDGLLIRWSLKSIGFGELDLYRYSKTGEWLADVEELDVEMVEKIIKLAAPSLAKIMVTLEDHQRNRVDA